MKLLLSVDTHGKVPEINGKVDLALIAGDFAKGDIYARDKSFCVHTELALNWLLTRAIEEKTKKKNPLVQSPPGGIH